MEASIKRAECIIETARTFGIDISDARNPESERQCIVKNGDYWIYTPRDVRIRRKTRLNIDVVDLSLYFNPRLPPDAYYESDLYDLCLDAGLIGEDSYYSRLMAESTQPTFYHGKHITITNTDTPFVSDAITELDNEDVVCFGILREEMIAFTYREILNVFRSKKKLELSQGVELTDRQVNKLYRMCERLSDSIGEEVCAEIDIIKMRTNERMWRLNAFLDVYDHGTEQTQTSIRQALEAMIHMAMYMRGWNGETAFPISSAPVPGRDILAVRTTDAIARFEASLSALGSVEQTLRTAPLFVYDDEIVASTIYTIGSRLEVVKRGEEEQSIDSCIRISSNWFAATAWYYMRLLRLPEPFDITELLYTS